LKLTLAYHNFLVRFPKMIVMKNSNQPQEPTLSRFSVNIMPR